MTTPEQHRAAARDRMVPEVTAAMALADFPIRAWPPDWRDREDVAYFYVSGSVLTREEDVPRVAEALRDLPGPLAATSDRSGTGEVALDRPTDGLARFRLPGAQDFGHDSDPTPGVVDELERRLGPGVASHEHAFEVTYVHCPATEPLEAVPPGTSDLAAHLWPPPSDGDAGTGVLVSVVDTGLLDHVADWAPWLTGVVPGSAPDDIDPADAYDVITHQPNADGFADPYAAHGSFISGVIRCVAPGAEIVNERLIGPSGFVAETSMITQIRQALSRSPDIVSLSAGGHTRNDDPPIGLQLLYRQRFAQQGGVVLVAAAGNDATNRPFWPAAFDWAVGVGSMTRDGQQRSWFTNHGSWVDAYAPGEDIVNVYARLDYETVNPPHERRRTSAGLARWSGTSFATPVVAGLVAARMSRTGENGRQAAQAVLAAARAQFRPGVGPRLFP
ncbi:S8 family serine peptidase [uncultured Jatrophihabitans sp.]|uniref:S8 family peptidase n=1 Tax=uncultured Jatrophihabitans sp. TaxID=1610747 RepID=UPI0035CA2380